MNKIKTKVKSDNFSKNPVRKFIVNSDIQKNLPDDLLTAIKDTREHRNLNGPFNSAADALKSMLED